MTRSSPDRFGELLFYVTVLLVGYLAFTIIQPFLAPLAWAAIFAMTMYPLQRWLMVRVGQTRAALVTTTVAAVLIVGPLATLVSVLANDIPRAVAFIKTLPETATPERVQLAWDVVRDRSPVALPEDPTQLLSQAVQTAVTFIAPRIGGVAANIATTLGSLFVMLFALFFLLRDGPRLGEVIRQLLPFREEERDRLISETRDLVIASVGAGLTVSAVQGIIGGLAFWALGVGVPVAWGVAIFVSSLIPVVGAGLIWAPLAIWWLLSGEVVRGLILVGIGAGLISAVDNVLRPVLLSGRTSVSGLVIFIGLLGGVSALGFVGLVLGPIVLVTAGTLLEALARHPEQQPLTASKSAQVRPGAESATKESGAGGVPGTSGVSDASRAAGATATDATDGPGVSARDGL
ncbi:MAG: AI-2E family transporter [Acidobacteriota bacterium]